jgi:hypothetical protein
VLTVAGHELLARLAVGIVAAMPARPANDIGWLTWTRDAIGQTAPLAAIDQALDPIADFVLAGMLIVIVLRGAFGWPSTMAQAWAVLRPRFARLVWASILLGLASAGVTMLLVTVVLNSLADRRLDNAQAAQEATTGIAVVSVGGLILLVVLQTYLVTATPVLVVEKEEALASIARTGRLLRNSWWRTFWLLVLTNILAQLVDLVLGLVPVVGSYLAALVNAAFVATVTTLVYLDLRLRKEGSFDAAFYRLIGIPTSERVTAITTPSGSLPPDRAGAAPVPAVRPDPPRRHGAGVAIVALLLVAVVATIVAVRAQVESNRLRAAQEKHQAQLQRQEEVRQRAEEEARDAKSTYLAQADAACGQWTVQLPSGRFPDTWSELDTYFTQLSQGLNGMLQAWAAVPAPTAELTEIRAIFAANDGIRIGIDNLLNAIQARDSFRYQAAVNSYKSLNAEAVRQRTQEYGFQTCGNTYYTYD